MRPATELADELANRIRELAEIRIQYAHNFHRVYWTSHESSVAGRNREAEYNCLDLYADQLRCEAEIDALKVLLEVSRAS